MKSSLRPTKMVPRKLHTKIFKSKVLVLSDWLYHWCGHIDTSEDNGNSILPPRVSIKH